MSVNTESDILTQLKQIVGPEVYEQALQAYHDSGADQEDYQPLIGLNSYAYNLVELVSTYPLSEENKSELRTAAQLVFGLCALASQEQAPLPAEQVSAALAYLVHFAPFSFSNYFDNIQRFFPTVE